MPANGPVHPVRFFDFKRKLTLWWCAGAMRRTAKMMSTPMTCHHTLMSPSSATTSTRNVLRSPWITR